jgi:hypothetical protein
MLNSLTISRRNGAFITMLLGILLIFLFFHRHILEANNVSFGRGGDGLKSTYGSLYHIEHDTSYWIFEGMNYPYGESVMYTGNQTYLTNVIKLCKDTGLDFSRYTLGILNLCMLFSYVICALFLYLILTELRLPVWYAILGGILITFLSPQWQRMSGHYNLAYAHVIPITLYLMIRFYRKPGFLISILFGLFMLIISGKHIYFIALIGLPWGIYWIFLLARSRHLYGKTVFLIPHLLIQMVVPFILFSIFMGSHDSVVDRTAYPWGFFYYNTRWVSVFLPLMKPYAKWIIVGPVKTLGYVGMVSTVVFIASLVLVGVRWVRRDLSTAWKITDQFILNALLAGGVLCLFLALGYPFTINPELLNYSGPFRQLRAVGRFTIPFYYIMNIYTFYILWQWFGMKEKRWFMHLLMLALALIAIEAYFTVQDKPDQYYNKYETLNDWENTLPDNHWVEKHDWSSYQAIMPMPYYHVGSENYWVGGNSPLINESYIASLKTGLPLNSVTLSRTSISQTLANLDLFWEPGNNYPVLRDYDPQKPLLIIKHMNGILNATEVGIIEKSTLIDSNMHLKFYRLNPDSLEALRLEHAERKRELAESYSRDTMEAWIFFESFDSMEEGHFTGNIKENTEFAACTLPDSGRYEISFWYYGAGKDLWPRTNLFISLFDSTMNAYSHHHTDLFRETVMRDGEWALVSLFIDVRSPSDYIKLYYANNVLTGGEILIDRILVRPSSDSLIIEDHGELLLNNRIVPAQKE